jgi:hypothetical protein
MKAEGTPVTIYGTGFSTTASQNTVTFNGVSATVVSASANEILTSVPSGATTGPIIVSTPIGSATSQQPFMVDNGGPPVVTGTSVSIAAPGTSVTITGSNFDATAARNKVRFNNTYAPVFSATSNTIVTSVPPSTSSGRVSVSTELGAGTSTNDVFIVPEIWYVPQDVDSTGRLVIGVEKTVAINTPNKFALVTFDGERGQRWNLRMTNVTVQGSVRATVYEPQGEQIAEGTSNANGGLLPIPPLPSTGSYTMKITPQPLAETGSVTIDLILIASPANDDFKNAQPISGSGGTVNASNVGASSEIGEPGHAVFCYPPEHGKSVWYQWTAPGSGTVTIDTIGSSIPTGLGVYMGVDVRFLTLVANNNLAPNVPPPHDGHSLVSFNAVAGTVYQIAIDGNDCNSGSLVLRWNLVP